MAGQQAFIPWHSVAAGVTAPRTEPLTFGEALESPCATCSTSPCCTHLPVHTFRVATLGDLSYAAYLLNFDRIRLGVTRTGDWSAYYVRPCRFLDPTELTCTVHETAQQPQICRNYNPFQCWYRRSMTASVTDDFMFIDRSRLEFIAEHVRFDDQRAIVAIPDWDDLLVAFAGLSDDEPWDEQAAIPDDGARTQWQRQVLDPDGVVPAHRRLLAFADDAEPCGSCSAPCCETVEFPQGHPTSRSSLDFFQFCLGFPGVELLISDAGWTLAVKTRCRHLADGRCSVYGDPQRPLLCRYYDAWRCTYRDRYLTPRPTASLRITLEDFGALTDTVTVDATGTIVEIEPLEGIRSRMEAAWRKAAGLGQEVS
ncbi:hypothetical protein FHP29_12665 [Nocardioides albidus]|uniref:YkgJ family cysteine cluster protein n=1 Tax=Nocardioides albidus TaxID=1517589 RepID=A0A5C4VUX2_9ACTN|nr:hypothetical protein [Nocardioides albidus]TNM39712.1 hypothetical protein FHP29_12665 [Nocardioides albidus]